jgi:hypothetical protein
MFSTGRESIIEVLVRAGIMKPSSKPICAEKGLQDINRRDGLITPFFLDNVLHHTSQTPQTSQIQNLSQIPTTQTSPLQSPTTPSATSSVHTPSIDGAREWFRSLGGLGAGSVRLKDLGTTVREVKSVEWKEMAILVLFRFRCGIPIVGSDIAAPSAGLGSPVGAGLRSPAGGGLGSPAGSVARSVEEAGWVMEGAGYATKSIPEDWKGGLSDGDTEVESGSDVDDSDVALC